MRALSMGRFSLPDPAIVPRTVALEMRSDAVAWAEAAWRPGGVRLISCGEEPQREGESPAQTLERLARRVSLHRAQLRVTIRHPELRLTRIALPNLNERDARRVAQRRGHELAQELGEPANATFAISRNGADRCAWIAAVPEEFAGVVERQWRQRVGAVAEFESLHLAIGALARLLPQPADGELRAFFDVGDAHATCVVADGEGWLFSRDVPLKMMADTLGVEGEAEASPSERVATELRRTLHYVESELRLGRVTDVIVSGAHSELEQMIEDLARETRRDTRMLGDAIGEGPASGASARMGVALGAAMCAVWSRGGSLLPAPAARERKRRRWTGRLALATGLFLALAIGGGLYVGGSLHSLDDELSELERTWLLVAPLREKTRMGVEARRRANRLAAVLPEFEAAQPPWAGALDTIGALLPDDAVMRHFRATQDEQGTWHASLEVEFPGVDLAEAAASVSSFAGALGNSPLWRVENLERTLTAPLPATAGSAARVHFRVDAALAEAAFDAARTEVPRG